MVVGEDGVTTDVGLLTASEFIARAPSLPVSPRKALVDFGRAFTARVLPPNLPAQEVAARPVDACDALAAQPYDPNKKAMGMTSDQMDSAAGEAACGAAIQKMKHEARFRYQHGRALNLLGRYEEALAAFKTSIGQGYPMAYVGRYNMFDNGHDPSLTTQQAFELLRTALEKGVGVAGHLLADQYWFGTRVPKDQNEAVRLYQRAAALRYPDSHRKLSELYENGEILPWDIERALYHQILAVYEAEQLGLGKADQSLRRASLARLLDPASVVRIWNKAIPGQD